MMDYFNEYIKSKAFIDDPTKFIRALNEYPDSLIIFSNIIIKIVNTFKKELIMKSQNYSHGYMYDAQMISEIIIRLYEQAQDSNSIDIQNQCLDALDILLENRIGRTIEIIKNIENM